MPLRILVGTCKMAVKEKKSEDWIDLDFIFSFLEKRSDTDYQNERLQAR